MRDPAGYMQQKTATVIGFSIDCFKIAPPMSWNGDNQNFLTLTRTGMTIGQNSANNIFQQDPTNDHGRKEQTERGYTTSRGF